MKTIERETSGFEMRNEELGTSVGKTWKDEAFLSE